MTPRSSLRACLAGFASDPVPDEPVDSFVLDSHAAIPGSVFLAVRGAQRHGLEFLDEARGRGARMVVYEPGPGIRAPAGFPAVSVPDLRHHVGEIAARFYGNPSEHLTIDAVTGTNGKTSVAWFLTQALDRLGERTAYLGTLGAGLLGAITPQDRTTPDPVALQLQLAEWLKRGVTAVSLEASSHALDQGRLAGTRITLGLFSNLTHDHLDYHGDLVRYREAKSKLFRDFALQGSVFNVRDPVGRDLARQLDPDRPLIRVALEPVPAWAADLWIDAPIEHHPDGMRFLLRDRTQEVPVTTPLWGRFNIENLLLVAGALRFRGLDFRAIGSLLEQLSPPPGRFERFQAPGRPLVVVDYAHTPDALEQALETLAQATVGELTVVFGCGGERDAQKRSIMGAIAARHARRIVLTDDNPRGEDPEEITDAIRTGIPKAVWVRIEHDRKLAIRLALETADPKGAVLVAGKGHETTQVAGGIESPHSDRMVVAELLGVEAPR
ncbi:MAG: UDP-N-acetylmuramoyl-L-alanyl-D-glutamate--2,6-diaminopimelate ligase [Gammaproteobacteria bacterium]